jgi:hypothetical protein
MEAFKTHTFHDSLLNEEVLFYKAYLVEVDGEKKYLPHPRHCKRYEDCFHCKDSDCHKDRLKE